MAVSQAGVRRDVRKMFERMSDELVSLISRNTDSEGNLDPRKEKEIVRAAGRIVERYFVGIDGRSVYAEDDITPLAEYPRTLNTWFGYVAERIVYSHDTWLRANIPEDVYSWLSTVKADSSQIEYDAPHYWVDPNGYRLSDRIWQTSVRTRTKIDRLLADLTRNGTSSLKASRQIESYVLPGRKLRTNKPYGTDASYDAMRLARTEITHHHSATSLAAAKANPYVELIDIVRSGSGDPDCPICPEHATIDIGGKRIREPYKIGSVRISPFHPHCKCLVVSRVVKSPDQVTENLREMISAGVDEYRLTPAQPDNFLNLLLGDLFLFYVGQRLFS